MLFGMDRILGKIWRLAIFLPLTVIFLPAFVIVTYLNKIWLTLFNEIFGL